MPTEFILMAFRLWQTVVTMVYGKLGYRFPWNHMLPLQAEFYFIYLFIIFT